MAKKYKLKFGEDKCKHMILGTDTDPDRHLTLGDLVLEKKPTYKYLGILINDKGTLRDHFK